MGFRDRTEVGTEGSVESDCSSTSFTRHMERGAAVGTVTNRRVSAEGT